MKTQKDSLAETYDLQDHPKLDLLYELSVKYARAKDRRSIEATFSDMVRLLDDEEVYVTDVSHAAKNMLKATSHCLACDNDLDPYRRHERGYCSRKCYLEKPPIPAYLEKAYGKSVKTVLEELITEHGSQAAACKFIGLGTSTMNKLCRDYGVVVKSVYRRRESIRKVEEEHNAPFEMVIEDYMSRGYRVSDMVRMFGIPDSTIRAYVPERFRKRRKKNV